MNAVFGLLRSLPALVHWYLVNHVFPKCMHHHTHNLSASGQELGGEILFGVRLGFSGTPSDLLPRELGSCVYERTSDGRVLHVLTDPRVVRCRRMPPAWTVRSLLTAVAAGAGADGQQQGQQGQRYSALIDSGALVTGMSNEEVARFLLHNGLAAAGVQGVVFLDRHDRALVLLRSGVIVPLEQCGLAPEQRFTFYDQVHTIGIDIKQATNACAAVTLGKDMTFRGEGASSLSSTANCADFVACLCRLRSGRVPHARHRPGADGGALCGARGRQTRQQGTPGRIGLGCACACCTFRRRQQREQGARCCWCCCWRCWCCRSPCSAGGSRAGRGVAHHQQVCLCCLPCCTLRSVDSFLCLLSPLCSMRMERLQFMQLCVQNLK